MIMIVIYNKTTKDHPRSFVVRKWTIGALGVVPSQGCLTADTIEEARRHLPSDAIQVPIDPSDDPVIGETWISMQFEDWYRMRSEAKTR